MAHFSLGAGCLCLHHHTENSFQDSCSYIKEPLNIVISVQWLSWFQKINFLLETHSREWLSSMASSWEAPGRSSWLPALDPLSLCLLPVQLVDSPSWRKEGVFCAFYCPQPGRESSNAEHILHKGSVLCAKCSVQSAALGVLPQVLLKSLTLTGIIEHSLEGLLSWTKRNELKSV